MAKGYVLGSIFKSLFENDLYFELAQRTYGSSRVLVEELKARNVEMLFGAESNQIFLKLDDTQIDYLSQNNLFEIDRLNNTIRLVTSYNTSDEEIEGFLEDLEEILW